MGQGILLYFIFCFNTTDLFFALTFFPRRLTLYCLCIFSAKIPGATYDQNLSPGFYLDFDRVEHLFTDLPPKPSSAVLTTEERAYPRLGVTIRSRLEPRVGLPDDFTRRRLAQNVARCQHVPAYVQKQNKKKTSNAADYEQGCQVWPFRGQINLAN